MVKGGSRQGINDDVTAVRLVLLRAPQAVSDGVAAAAHFDRGRAAHCGRREEGGSELLLLLEPVVLEGPGRVKESRFISTPHEPSASGPPARRPSFWRRRDGGPQGQLGFG